MTAATLEAPTEVESLDENAGIPPVLLDLMGRVEMKPTFKGERGLLYSFRPKQNVATLEGYEPTIKELEYEVSVKPETITVREITYTSGVNFKAKKVYRSWKTDRAYSMSLKTEKYGHRVLRIYEHITRTKRWRGSFTNSTARHLQAFDFDPRVGVPDLYRVADIKSEYENLKLDPSSRHLAYTFAGWALYQILKELDPNSPALTAQSFAGVAAYPTFQLFPNSVFNVKAIKDTLGKSYNLHSEPDVKKFIAKAFGSDGIRKDMVKAVVSTTDINALFLAARLKNLFPLDWLRDFVKSPLEHAIYDHKGIYTEENTEGLVALLASLTLPQRKRLLMEKRPAGQPNDGAYGRDHSVLIRDSVRMFSGLNPEQKAANSARIDYSSWRNLHDTLIQITNEIRRKERTSYEDAPFDLGETYMAKLHGTSYTVEGESYGIIAPKNRGMLYNWGNEMHNCIGSYSSQVTNHETNVFAVYHEKKLFANVEISNNGVIMQHMKKYNSPAPEEHVTALGEHIRAVDEEIRKRIAKEKRVEEAMNRRRAVAA
jgi:hypothetical protein